MIQQFFISSFVVIKDSVVFIQSLVLWLSLGISICLYMVLNQFWISGTAKKWRENYGA
jgi:hypothetical protein